MYHDEIQDFEFDERWEETSGIEIPIEEWINTDGEILSEIVLSNEE